MKMKAGRGLSSDAHLLFSTVIKVVAEFGLQVCSAADVGESFLWPVKIDGWRNVQRRTNQNVRHFGWRYKNTANISVATGLSANAIPT